MKSMHDFRPHVLFPGGKLRPCSYGVDAAAFKRPGKRCSICSISATTITLSGMVAWFNYEADSDNVPGLLLCVFLREIPFSLISGML